MRFRKTAVVLTSVAMVSLGSAAWAAGPYQVDVGSHTSGDHVFHAVSDGGINFVVKRMADPEPFEVPMSCSSVEAEGNVHAGPNATGDNVATIQDASWATHSHGTPPNDVSYTDDFDSSKWDGCLGPFSLGMAVEQNSDWNLDVSGTATSAVTDVLTGKVSNVNAHVYATSNPPACNFDVTGHADGTFDENVDADGFQKLNVNETGFSGDLTVSGVTVGVNDCFGMVENGDPANFVGSFKVHALDGAINVK